MKHSGSVTRLVAQLKSPDPAQRNQAARLIWERYFHELLALARVHLEQRIRRREDEEDVLQSMYKSFIRRQERGDFDLLGRDDLWNLLVTITLRKARNTAVRHRSARRDVRREHVAISHGDDGSSAADWALEQMDAGCPTADQAAVLNEELERRLRMLIDPALRLVALRKLEGFSNKEIARELNNCTERTVERKLERIRTKWSATDPT